MKRVAELRKALPEGLSVEQVGTGRHIFCIVWVETGEPLRGESGIPIRIATSPSDRRAQKNVIARARRAFEAELQRAIKEAS